MKGLGAPGYTAAMHQPDIAGPSLFGRLRKPTNFYVVRHGESVANAQNRIQGRSDFPLNDRGRQQAEACGRWFAGKDVRAVVCSPLARARETAEILCRAAGFAPPEPEALFMELETGRFSGLTLAEARDKHPQDYARFERHSWEGVADAERSHQLAARALEAWRLLVDKAIATGGDVAALSHGGLIQWLVRITFGCTSWLPLLPTGNCGLYRLVVEPRGLTDEGEHVAMLQWKEMNLLPPMDGKRVEQVF